MIITPPFTEMQKKVVEATKKLANKKKLCDVDGVDDIAITNFDKVTASPEALTIFIEDIMMPCYGCNVESIKNCPHKKKSGVRFCDRKECFKWLNEECKE